MTSERDFDRLARAWLDLGPNEAPDRVVAAVLQAAETTPQVRRPIGRSFWRSFHMTRLPIIATVVATLVVVIGGALFLTRGSDQGVGAPIATPSASASVAPAGAVPSALQGRWIGGPRTFPGAVPTVGTQVNFNASTFALGASNQADSPFMIASASGSPDGNLRLSNSAGCHGGDVGEYRWSVSPGRDRLTISAVSDPCAVRLAAVNGEWLKVACKNPQDACLGDLAAGTYPSQFIRPRLPAGAAWAPEYAAITYTVPDGWANSADWPSDFQLVPSTDYASFGPDGGPDGVFNEIVVKANPAMSDQRPDCKGQEVTTIDRTVDGFIGWIRSQARITSTAPTAITVGGRPGQWIDVKIAPDWKEICPGTTNGTPAAIFLTVVGGTGKDESAGMLGQEQMRLVFVDLGGGDIVVIWVDSTDPAKFDQLATDAMPIIESMTFK